MTYSSEYYKKNKEAVAAKQKKYREENREAIREYQKQWRTDNEGHTYESPDGYVKYIGYAHPATNASGITSEHRIVLWDKLGGKDANCHWCEKPLSWAKTYPEDGAMVTDHVNTVKNDNRPENLVPSCALCNITREGGQNRKPSPNADRACGAVDGCDRRGATHSHSNPDLWVCMPHYMQDWAGKEFTPLRTYYPRGGVSETEKECVVCDTWKPHSEFYWRNGKPKGVCKKCEIKRATEAKRKRLAMGEPCSVDGCATPALVKGMCQAHYQAERMRQIRETEEMKALGLDYEVEFNVE